jgi:hypothetical protein
MNKRILCAVTAAIILSACQDKPAETETVATDSVTNISAATDSLPAADSGFSEDDQYAIYYLAIADTGNDYYRLDEKMYSLNKSLKLEIDTMNRYYNTKKQRIVLNDNDEDELYRGEYFPRRFPAESLSLEYLDTYNEQATPSTIALVAGVYENKQLADSMLSILKPYASGAYTLQAKVYIGCMH